MTEAFIQGTDLLIVFENLLLLTRAGEKAST